MFPDCYQTTLTCIFFKNVHAYLYAQACNEIPSAPISHLDGILCNQEKHVQQDLPRQSKLIKTLHKDRKHYKM